MPYRARRQRVFVMVCPLPMAGNWAAAGLLRLISHKHIPLMLSNKPVNSSRIIRRWRRSRTGKLSASSFPLIVYVIIG